jgi:hypothetical protein
MQAGVLQGVTMRKSMSPVRGYLTPALTCLPLALTLIGTKTLVSLLLLLQLLLPASQQAWLQQQQHQQQR